MKGTEHFTRAIAEYLNQRAATDSLFAPNLMKPNKSIEEWKSHTNLTHAGKYFRPSKVKITSPTLPK